MKSPEPAWLGRPTRLVLFHGLASSPKEFGFLTHPLRRHGVRLVAPELPGYSAGTLVDGVTWRDWVDAAVRWLDAVDARHKRAAAEGHVQPARAPMPKQRRRIGVRG